MAHEITMNPLRGVELRDDNRHFGVYDHGAHVWAWQPEGAEPVLWMSANSAFETGQPIRGGVPVCFPWFGPGRSGDLQPAHGFARLNEWQLVEDEHTDDGGLRVVYRIDNSIAPVWPTRGTHISTPMAPPRPLGNGTYAFVEPSDNARPIRLPGVPWNAGTRRYRLS